VSPRPAHLALVAALLLLGARLRHASTPVPDATGTTSATATAASPHPVLAAETSPEPAPSPVAEPLPPGVTGVWHGRLDAPLSSLAPTATRDFTPPVDIVVPVSAGERIAVRLHRHDVTSPDGGTFVGEIPGHPGGTVVLSYVGAAQAGVVYLPDESRSFVISGGDDGRIRVTSTDLTRAPGCAPESSRPAPL